MSRSVIYNIVLSSVIIIGPIIIIIGLIWGAVVMVIRHLGDKQANVVRCLTWNRSVVVDG